MQSSTGDRNACQFIIFDSKFSCDLKKNKSQSIMFSFSAVADQKGDTLVVVVHALYFLKCVL